MEANSGIDATLGREYENPTIMKDKSGESYGNRVVSDKVGPEDDGGYDELCSDGLKMLKLKNWEEATTAFTKALNIKPENELLYMHRSLAFLRLKNYEDAEGDCTQALALKPDLAKAYMRRSKSRKLLGKFIYAALDLVRVMELQHEFELPMSVARSEYDDLVFLVIDNHDYSERLGLKAQLEELSRKEEYFGDYFLREQRWSEAIVKLTNAIKLTQGSRTQRLRDLFHHRGNCWKKMGYSKFNLGEADYTSAISIDDKNYSLYSKRSMIRSEMGNSSGALEDLARMILLNSDSNYIPSDVFKRYLDASARLQRIKSVIAAKERSDVQKRLVERHKNLGKNANEPCGGVLLLPGLVSSSDLMDDDAKINRVEIKFNKGDDTSNRRFSNSTESSDSDIGFCLEDVPFVFRDKDFEEEIDNISTTDEENKEETN